jgi:amino acid adenylation domain-containing protein
MMEGTVSEESHRAMSMEAFSSSGGNTYDLTYFIIPAETIVFKFKYNARAYDEAFIGRLNDHLNRLIGHMTANPSLSINQLEYMGMEEKQQLLRTFGRAEVYYPPDKTIVDLFNEQVLRTPDYIAVVFGEKKLTYRQLDEKANQLAGHLRMNSLIAPGDLVGVMLDRSESVIVAIMGILKSGGAYVVIEPEYPRARKEFIINDTQIRVMITQTAYLFDLEHYTGELFAIDVQLEVLDAAQAEQAPVARPEDLAYVVYTSGSTGQPKGVMVTHGCLMDYHFGILGKTNMRDCNSFGLVSTIAADLGNTVVYVALLIGGTLHIFSTSDVMNAERMTGQNLDCIKIVPSHWMALQLREKPFVPNKCLIFGGEQLPGEVIDVVQGYNAGCEVYNHYGPSETTIGKLVRRIYPGHPMAPVSLGSPFGNTSVYVLNTRNSLLPIGVAGEICIGGDGLAKGYLNNATLTASKFVPDPFIKDAIIYKTGDLGRWLPDGSIEFLGRRDDQVKIRGYRIELGEIAEVLQRHPSIEKAIVLAKQGAGGDMELTAYIVPRYPCDHLAIRAYLRDKLPEYMVPVHYIKLDQIPLTSNGKVDKKRLPEPGGVAAGSGAEYIPPRNDIDEKLVMMFREILRKDKVGIKDNFFELGGHSLKVVQLISRINIEFLVQVNIQSIFKEATVESISEHINFILDQNKQKQHADRLIQIEI